jgi:hypothetical protein
MVTSYPSSKFGNNEENARVTHILIFEVRSSSKKSVPTSKKMQSVSITKTNWLTSTWDHEILYTDRSSKDEQILIISFSSKTKNTNMTAVWMLKFIVLFCGDNSWTVTLRQMNFGIVRDHRHTYKFYLDHYFVWRRFKYGDGANFELMLW